MEIIMSLLAMLGGVAVFMYGMKIMSQGMEQSASAGVRKLFKKLNKNKFIDYGIGIGATAIVQSSSATSIMTVGLANAGIVTVKQGSGIILGAKVGTTITAFVFAIGLMSKGSFSISAVFAAVAFIGVIIIYTTDKSSLKKLGLFLIGFGMLFVGLEVMESAINGTGLSSQLEKLFRFDAMLNPALLVLLGVIFTCVIQSSTAAMGIFLTLVATKVITLDQSFFLIMGANIGTCLDGILASFGTNENGKRIALFHVLTSTIGAVVFSVVLAIFRGPVVGFFERIVEVPAFSLASFNLAYNFIYTIILLACLNPLVALVCRIIKKKEQGEDKKSYFIDERLLASPTIAIQQAVKEVYNMAVMAQENLDRAFKGMIDGELKDSKLIAEQEYKIDEITRALASYFIKISSLSISARDDKLIGGLHHVINDIERVGDYAVDIARETNYMIQLSTQFMEESKHELSEIHGKISELFALSIATFQSRKTNDLKKIADLHHEIDSLISAIKDIHIARLSSHMYPVEVSKSLYTALISLQRVADHVVNIAFSIRSDTGSKSETFAIIEKDKKK